MKQVINCTKIVSSKTFEKKVLKFFKNTDERDLYIDSVGMSRNQQGSYNIFLTVSIGRGGGWIDFKQHTNDSGLWDWYTDVEYYSRAYQNWAKATVLELLSEGTDKITEFYIED